MPLVKLLTFPTTLEAMFCAPLVTEAAKVAPGSEGRLTVPEPLPWLRDGTEPPPLPPRATVEPNEGSYPPHQWGTKTG